MHRRLLSILAAGTVALGAVASPALAGSDGCSGGDCRAENAPASVVPVVPTPVGPSALTARQTRTFGLAEDSVPRGAVAAGQGGEAEDGSDGVLFGLVGGVLLTLAAGGRLIVAARRSKS
jgi:hypothetical protein